jgi:bifunctional DNA-binding transcriptional regulator/antitoxin component of YhaV-PrlF toxin-antitoxin module
MDQRVIKNKREKISPGGVLTLPVAARKTLGMTPKKGSRVSVAVDGGAVWLQPAGDDGGFRVSPRGQIELRGDAREILEGGLQRHYWLELDDASQRIVLHPYE